MPTLPSCKVDLPVAVDLNAPGQNGNTMTEREYFLKRLHEARMGDVRAMFDVGERYAEGIGVTVSAKDAVRWYEKGAKLDDSDCMIALAICYTHGLGVPVDRELARTWWDKVYKLDRFLTLRYESELVRNRIGMSQLQTIEERGKKRD